MNSTTSHLKHYIRVWVCYICLPSLSAFETHPPCLLGLGVESEVLNPWRPRVPGLDNVLIVSCLSEIQPSGKLFKINILHIALTLLVQYCHFQFKLTDGCVLSIKLFQTQWLWWNRLYRIQKNYCKIERNVFGLLLDVDQELKIHHM